MYLLNEKEMNIAFKARELFEPYLGIKQFKVLAQNLVQAHS